MTIGSRLTILFLSSALLMGGLAAIITAQRDYQIRLDQVVNTSSARLAGRTELQYLIYTRDGKALEASLTRFLLPEAVASTLVYNGPGELLAQRARPGASDFKPLPFSSVRGNLMVTDTALVSIDEQGEPIGTGLLSAFTRGDHPLYYSLPVITAANPAERGLTALDFARAEALGNPTDSERIVGYLHLLIDRAQLMATVVPGAARVMLFSLLFALCCSMVAWYFTRRITRSLRQLAQLADDVTSGSLEQPVQIEGSREIREIAYIFNSMIGGMSNARIEANVDRRLLSMKVEERNAQLSERNRELDHAVEEVSQARHQLHHVSNYDGLTRLPNRRLFTEQLGLLLKLNKRNKHTLALLCIDLDNFKRVNDTLGLNAGDQLLCRAAELIQGALRESDSVGHFSNEDNEISVSRLGGDEFSVVLNQVASKDSARQVAQRLVERLKQPLDIEGHEVIITPSVGIALAPADGAEPRELLRAASTAKLEAKGDGDCLEFYSAELESAGEERLRMESDLRKAIERNEMELHYQPQVDTHSGSVVGVEALLRWNHSELGQIPPADFLGIAKDIDLMDEFNDWVLGEACQQVRRFGEEGIKLPRVAINVSSGQFSTRFVQRVGQVIHDTGIEPEQLELGLSEAIMSSLEQDTVEALKVLKEIGVYLSVDDFGTGYSPLNYLSQYPLDELKIDRSFLLESSRSENGAKLVVAIIAMAQSLGLRVLATGVESEHEFSFLTENGAHIIQGYLFSEPVPAHELRPMLGAWHFVEKVQQLSNAGAASALDRLSQFE